MNEPPTTSLFPPIKTIPFQINLGSGQRKFKGPWINIDCQAKWEPDVVASDLSSFKSNSASMIVLHHVLEHFGCGEASTLIKDCHRVLAPKGSLIITVPDMSALAKGWLRGQISDQIYFTNVYGAHMGDEADRHKWGYTSLHLGEFLYQCANWKEIQTFDHRPIEGADIARDWWILGQEAIK